MTKELVIVIIVIVTWCAVAAIILAIGKGLRKDFDETAAVLWPLAFLALITIGPFYLLYLMVKKLTERIAEYYDNKKRK